jgi:glycosyltransferase involved in cell wall biosynthesis
MKLVIVHYHLRPGGVRRVIELATPHLVSQFGNSIDSIILASGEKPDDKWEKHFRGQLKTKPVKLFIDPSLAYFSEQNLPASQVQKRLQDALKALLGGFSSENVMIWAHNLGIGRNLLLTRELTRICVSRNIPLALHHHDWWFDNRWLRWEEMYRSGFRTLSLAARAIFPAARSLRHLTINRADALCLRSHFPQNSCWLPNLIERPMPPTMARIRKARSWLRNIVKDDSAPIWILPCRGLRRKNIAEALLLVRWLRPTAWLVTTCGASSANERPYFDKLAAAAREYRWPLRLGVLRGDETNKPAIAELLAASEAVMLTSIQEGFGLPYLEAAAARRPLIARSLPNVAPDLARFGFRFPQYYHELLIDARLFDWRAEKKRQAELFRSWRQSLPQPVRHFAGVPEFLAKRNARSFPFSRLTLTAQLEVLAKPVELSWPLCAPLNPFLATWRKRAQTGRLQLTAWPSKADNWLSGATYARRFAEILSHTPKHPPQPTAGPATQLDFLRAKLQARQLFPLLWSTSA